jgi:tetratricopeptide (TPR) repeat protein
VGNNRLGPWNLAEGWTAAGTVALALFTIGLVWFAFRSYALARREADRRSREFDARVRTYSAWFINPAKFVGAYRVRTTSYLPIAKDVEIATALERGVDALILGRGGIGKSHAAIHHIKCFAKKHWYQRWRLCVPDRHNLTKVRLAQLPRRNYVLFFDDINEFVKSSDEFTIFDVIDAIRDRATRLRIVATIRSTASAIDSINETKLFGRFQSITLDDWTDKQCDDLATKAGATTDYWDGTPLSIKKPSDEQKYIYERLPEGEKRVLECAKVCYEWGLHYCDKSLLGKVAVLTWPHSPDESFAAAIRTLERLGFLKRCDEVVQVYRPYLAFVRNEENQAIFESLRVVLLEPGFTRELYFAGVAAYAKEKFDTAIEFMSELVRREPQMEAGHYRLALIYRRRSDLDSAIRHFVKAVEIQPSYVSALYRLAECYKRLGDKKRTDATFARAHQAQLGYGPASLLLLAEEARKVGDYEEALELITQCLNRDPDIRFGWGIKGQILLRLKRPVDAETAFMEAILHQPDAFAYFGLGQTLRARKEWVGAAEAFKKATELQPELGDTYPLLGQALQQCNNTDKAISAFQQAIKLGQLSEGYFGLGLAYKQKKEWQEALNAFEAATVADPQFALAYSYLGTAYEKCHNLEKAFLAHQKAVEIDPNNKHMLYSLAYTQSQAGLYADAIKNCGRCLTLDPNFKRAADLLVRLGKN